MLSPANSPIHRLATLWWRARLPVTTEIPACRARLFEAATHEITANANAGHNYDPLADRRFLWATQYLALAEGEIKEIDPAILATAAVFLDPNPVRQPRHHLAAGG